MTLSVLAPHFPIPRALFVVGCKRGVLGFSADILGKG